MFQDVIGLSVLLLHSVLNSPEKIEILTSFPDEYFLIFPLNHRCFRLFIYWLSLITVLCSGYFPGYYRGKCIICYLDVPMSDRISYQVTRNNTEHSKDKKEVHRGVKFEGNRLHRTSQWPYRSQESSLVYCHELFMTSLLITHTETKTFDPLRFGVRSWYQI